EQATPANQGTYEASKSTTLPQRPGRCLRRSSLLEFGRRAFSQSSGDPGGSPAPTPDRDVHSLWLPDRSLVSATLSWSSDGRRLRVNEPGSLGSACRQASFA